MTENEHCINLRNKVARYLDRHHHHFSMIYCDMKWNTSLARYIRDETNVNGFIKQANYLHKKHYKNIPLGIIMNAICEYLTYWYACDKEEMKKISEIRRPIIESEADKMIETEFRLRFKMAGKHKWFTDWLLS